MSGHHGNQFIPWQEFTQALDSAFDQDQALANLDSFSPIVNEVARSADRWILTSNLHKTIRLGLAVEAAATADALHSCDPEYFWRRFPVLAIEDVSLGDARLSAEVLAFSRSSPLRRRAGAAKLSGHLAARLALATKCRSPCDLLCLVNAPRGEEWVATELDRLSVSEAIDIACSPERVVTERAVALLRLDRLPVRGGDERAGVLGHVCDRLRVPPLLAQTVAWGKPTSGLAALQPLIYGLLADQPIRLSSIDMGLAGHMLDGAILSSALDKHTRLGQTAIREWVAATTDLNRFLAANGLVANAQRVVRLGLFHIESGVLHRRLTNDRLDQLLAESERAEMLALGLGPELAAELYALMRASHAGLHEIRRAVWARRGRG